MSSNKDSNKDDLNNLSGLDLNLSSSNNNLNLSSGCLDLDLTDNDVDDALNFDWYFDTMAETLGATLPNIDLNEMGSLGTRSPSPSGSNSVYSSRSKRSRAEFDESQSESECDSSFHSKQQRMIYHDNASGYGLGLGSSDQFGTGGSENEGQSSPNKVIRQGRERDGRCPDCGLDTHRIVMNDNAFELQPLTIEGEVLNGRCLLCRPLAENEMNEGEMSSVPAPEKEKAKKRGRKKKGESTSSSTKKDKGKKGSRSKKTEGSGNSNINMGSPPQPPQQQQQQQHRLPFNAPPGRSDSNNASNRRSSSGGGGFMTPTPNQYHSKMALMKQAQLPRKHSAMQHAMLAFGNTNNRRSSSNNIARKPSLGSRRNSSTSRGGKHSSNNSLSSVSCSEVEGSNHHHPKTPNNGDGDENYSRVSPYSQHSGAGGKSNTGMMGGMCTETASTIGPPMQRSMSSGGGREPQSSHPSTPQAQQRHHLSSSSSAVGQRTPQSVPPNMSNMMSSRVNQTPQSVPANMNNMMSARMQDSSSGSNMLGISDTMMGNVPQAVKVAHSKLQSSIYHHHVFPMNEETERAQGEKTLMYLESGSGDICDIIVAMRRFPFSLAIQRVACEKLYAHCFDQEHASAIGLVGGIRTIIDAMEHHPEDVALHRGCAGVIKHLATASSYNLDMLDRMGSVAIIVSTMERHPKNAPLLESCCWAMESMARSNSPEIKMRVAKGGGIHAAMKAVENFPNNESLLRAAFHCLRQLGYNPSSYNSNQVQQQFSPGQMSPQPMQQQQVRQNRGSGSSRGGVGGMNMMLGNMMMGGNNNNMMGGSSGNSNTGNNRRMRD